MGLSHGLNNYSDNKAKWMSSSKKFTCKGTLRQVFFRDTRLEIQSVLLVFSTQLYELLPLSTLLSGSGPQTDKYLQQSPFQVNFFIWRHFSLPSLSLIFLRSECIHCVQCTILYRNTYSFENHTFKKVYSTQITLFLYVSLECFQFCLLCRFW